MAWDEWEQIKADTAQEHSTRMRLNQVPVEPGGGPVPEGDLRVDQKDLAAIGDAAYRLFGDLDRFSDHARVSSMTAAGGLKSEGFALGGALDHVAERWVDQVRTLLDACAHISNHLDYTKAAHAGDEVYIAGTLSSISELDKGFDERKGQ
ncbi:hypothetical protein [Streptomyces liangshanensis]|uniref:AG1 protein n=1 Tax=Streptomyces liangshanensis TaxID=2717324 RepID=A0A6G9GVX4_9ACTN|nr:hypothetical protein [Streptomyces liangshanensis]QIQ02360.1 hypothetical protein HA039_08605 [Streptomyces liangshanensis]